MKLSSFAFGLALMPGLLFGQALNIPWAGYGHDPQHTAVSAKVSLSLTRIHWQTPVDLNPPGGGGPLFIHYGSPLVTAINTVTGSNTVIVPVKTGSADGFELKAFQGTAGSLLYTLISDYTSPSHNWIPPYGPTLSVIKNRIYYPGAGGTVYYRDSPDSATGASGQLAFYGLATYNANKTTFNSTVKISTPLASDRYGNIYFGFTVTGSNPASLASGIAKITLAGAGSWVPVTSLAGGDANMTQIALNASPALSNNQTTLYAVLSNGAEFGNGYLVSMNTSNLAATGRVQLLDPRGGGALATVSADSSAAPMVGPDGDVYFGVLEANCCSSHNDRGWMLHYNSALTQTKIPGSFGWDSTASVVAASLVPSYSGSSSYLLLTKYNNYAGVGTGDGVNKVAVIDPGTGMQDPIVPTVTVMKEVITVAGITNDNRNGFPNAVREWCINTAVIDPFTKSALINSEDGVLYRWSFVTNTLSESIRLTSGIGEAYTPTVIGTDGIVFAINDAVLYAVGD